MIIDLTELALCSSVKLAKLCSAGVIDSRKDLLACIFNLSDLALSCVINLGDVILYLLIDNVHLIVQLLKILLAFLFEDIITALDLVSNLLLDHRFKVLRLSADRFCNIIIDKFVDTLFFIIRKLCYFVFSLHDKTAGDQE